MPLYLVALQRLGIYMQTIQKLLKFFRKKSKKVVDKGGWWWYINQALEAGTPRREKRFEKILKKS